MFNTNDYGTLCVPIRMLTDLQGEIALQMSGSLINVCGLYFHFKIIQLLKSIYFPNIFQIQNIINGKFIILIIFVLKIFWDVSVGDLHLNLNGTLKLTVPGISLKLIFKKQPPQYIYSIDIIELYIVAVKICSNKISTIS